MSTPAPPVSGEESFVVVEGTDVDWGARCRDLAQLLLEPEWLGAEALEVAAALGLPGPATCDTPVRVVVLRRADGELPLKVRSRLSVEARPRAHYCPLPTRVLGGRTAVFDGIVLCESRRPLLVLDPERLAALAGSLSPPPGLRPPAA